MLRLAFFSALLVCTLGKSVPLIEYGGRIIGGDVADVGEYPSQVSILYAGLHNCGGTIISENYILTAAHCIKLPGPGLMSVRVGTNVWNELGVDHEIVSLYPHPNYNFTVFNTEDIGLIEVTPPIVFNDVTQPAKLPAQDQETPEGSDGIIVGWGVADIEGNLTIPFQLQEAFVTVRSYDECKTIYESETELTEAQLCADVPEGGVGVCNGDSGGPLYVNGELVGLTSWGVIPCGSQGFPGVFTRVASFRDWITEHSGV